MIFVSEYELPSWALLTTNVSNKFTLPQLSPVRFLTVSIIKSERSLLVLTNKIIIIREQQHLLFSTLVSGNFSFVNYVKMQSAAEIRFTRSRIHVNWNGDNKNPTTSQCCHVSPLHNHAFPAHFAALLRELRRLT